jgi:hypothetical protein
MSGWYLDGKEQLLARTIPEAAGVYMVGVNIDYDYVETHTDFAAFEDFVILPEAELQNVTFTNGVLDADNYKWLSAGINLAGKSPILQGVIVYFKLADAGTLLAFIDSAQVGLPQTLNGSNVTGQWAENGILKL